MLVPPLACACSPSPLLLGLCPTVSTLTVGFYGGPMPVPFVSWWWGTCGGPAYCLAHAKQPVPYYRTFRPTPCSQTEPCPWVCLLKSKIQHQAAVCTSKHNPGLRNVVTWQPSAQVPVCSAWQQAGTCILLCSRIQALQLSVPVDITDGIGTPRVSKPFLFHGSIPRGTGLILSPFYFSLSFYPVVYLSCSIGC